MKGELYEIAIKMNQAGLSEEFILSASLMACIFEGVYDLMVMWEEESDKEERDRIIEDIQKMIKECSMGGKK